MHTLMSSLMVVFLVCSLASANSIMPVKMQVANVSCYTGWRVIPGKLNYITASPNHLWGLTVTEKIYRCERPCTGKWILMDGAKKQIDADDGEVWGVNNANFTYKMPVDGNGCWELVGGKLKHISASGNGFLWAVSSINNIYKCNKPCNGTWNRIKGGLLQVDGGQEFVYGVSGDNRIWSMPVDGTGTGWREIPGRLTQITASGTNEVFGIDPDGNVLRCRKPCVGDWERMPGQLKQCEASLNELFGVDKRGTIYAYKL